MARLEQRLEKLRQHLVAERARVTWPLAIPQ